jgi:hypothetical protein
MYTQVSNKISAEQYMYYQATSTLNLRSTSFSRPNLQPGSFLCWLKRRAARAASHSARYFTLSLQGSSLDRISMLAEKVSNFKSPIFRMLSKVALCTDGQSLDANGGLNAIRYRLASLRRSRSGTAAILKPSTTETSRTRFIGLWGGGGGGGCCCRCLILSHLREEEQGHQDPSEACRL